MLSEGRVYGELYKQIDIIGLNLCGICCLISDGRAAFFAFIDDYIALFRIGQNLHGAENALTIVRSVSRVDVYMNRTQALGAVVSGGYSERLYLEAAALTDKAVIVFLKAFFFHGVYPSFHGFGSKVNTVFEVLLIISFTFGENRLERRFFMSIYKRAFIFFSAVLITLSMILQVSATLAPGVNGATPPITEVDSESSIDGESKILEDTGETSVGTARSPSSDTATATGTTESSGTDTVAEDGLSSGMNTVWGIIIAILIITAIVLIIFALMPRRL